MSPAPSARRHLLLPPPLLADTNTRSVQGGWARPGDAHGRGWAQAGLAGHGGGGGGVLGALPRLLLAPPRLVDRNAR